MSANKQIKSDVVEPKDEGDFAVLQLTYDESDAFWRRVVVPKNRNLDFLHAVIQAAFGWMNYHSYDFTKGRQSYVPDGVFAVDDEIKEKETKGTLIQTLFKRRGDKATYEYDLNDGNSVTIECLGFCDFMLEQLFAAGGQDLIEDSSAFKFTPGIVRLLTEDDRTKEAKRCREWLHESFELSVEDVLAIPSGDDIYGRVCELIENDLEKRNKTEA